LTGYQWASLALIPTFGLLWWGDGRSQARQQNSRPEAARDVIV
jgi:hypothetical protein